MAQASARASATSRSTSMAWTWATVRFGLSISQAKRLLRGPQEVRDEVQRRPQGRDSGAVRLDLGVDVLGLLQYGNFLAFERSFHRLVSP